VVQQEMNEVAVLTITTRTKLQWNHCYQYVNVGSVLHRPAGC